jgi:hypothetical protein
LSKPKKAIACGTQAKNCVRGLFRRVPTLRHTDCPHCEGQSDEAIQLRAQRATKSSGAWHQAARRADPLARNDGMKNAAPKSGVWKLCPELCGA